jgi:hypothetical protein
MLKKLFLLLAISLIATNCYAGTKTWQNGGVDTNWSTASNWVEGSKPVAGDDVVIAAAYDCIVNEATANLKSFDMTGYVNTLSGSSAITVIGAATSTDVVKFAGTITWTGTLNLNPTAADTNIQLTSSGKTIANITQNGNNAGDVYFIDAVTVTTAITLTNGVLHTDGAADNSGLSHTASYFTTATGTKTANLGNSTITLSRASAAAWTWITTNATLTEGTSTIVCNGATVTFAGGGETYATVTLSGSGIATISGINSFGTLNRTGTAVKTDYLVTSSNQTVTGTLNIDGNSSIDRVLFYATTLGTPITLTVTGATISGCSNVDFRDITFTSTGAMDFSAITGGSGDCGGNTVAGGGTLSFTTADDWFWQTTGAGTYNFSDATYWFTVTNGGGDSGDVRGFPPLPQDNCYFDADSVSGSTTIDQDMPRMCKTLDFTGVDAVNFHMNNISQTIYGSLIFVSNVTPTAGTLFMFEGRGVFTLDTLAKSFYQTEMRMFGGTLNLASSFTPNSYFFKVSNGTFNTNDYALSVKEFQSNNSNIRAINLGASIVTVFGFGDTSLDFSSTLSLNSGTSTITVNGATVSFTGAGLNFNNVIVNNTILQVNGSNTFNTFTINAPKTVKFTAGTTQTVNSFVTANSSPTKKVTLTSTTTAPAYLKDNQGTNSLRHCNISNLRTLGNAKWEALTTDGCVNLFNNSGFIFHPIYNYSRMFTPTGAVTNTSNFFLLF